MLQARAAGTSGCRIELLSHSRQSISNPLLPLDLSGWKYFSKSQQPALWPGEGLLQETGLEHFQSCHSWLCILRQCFPVLSLRVGPHVCRDLGVQRQGGVKRQRGGTALDGILYLHCPVSQGAQANGVSIQFLPGQQRCTADPCADFGSPCLALSLLAGCSVWLVCPALHWELSLCGTADLPTGISS